MAEEGRSRGDFQFLQLGQGGQFKSTESWAYGVQDAFAGPGGEATLVEGWGLQDMDCGHLELTGLRQVAGNSRKEQAAATQRATLRVSLGWEPELISTFIHDSWKPR